MIDATSEFEKLKAVHPSAQMAREGEQAIVLLPGFEFCSANRDLRMDLLLHPFAHSGYTTRLFFERLVEGKGQNWSQHCVAGRQWWTCSWNDVHADMDWRGMLYAHLRAVA